MTSHLRLGVRAEPGHGAVASELGHLGVELVGEDDGEGHTLLRLVGGVTKHQALHMGTRGSHTGATSGTEPALTWR